MEMFVSVPVHSFHFMCGGVGECYVNIYGLTIQFIQLHTYIYIWNDVESRISSIHVCIYVFLVVCLFIIWILNGWKMKKFFHLQEQTAKKSFKIGSVSFFLPYLDWDSFQTKYFEIIDKNYARPCAIYTKVFLSVFFSEFELSHWLAEHCVVENSFR